MCMDSDSMLRTFAKGTVDDYTLYMQVFINVEIIISLSFSLLRLPVGRGGVINSPRSIFLFFFGVRSWAAAHG